MLLSFVFDGQPTNVFVVDYFFSFEISLLWRQRCLFNFDLYVDRPSVAIYVARCVLCRCVFQDDGKTARMLSSHTPGDASITSTTISSSFSIFFTYLFISLSSSLFLSFSLLCFFVFFGIFGSFPSSSFSDSLSCHLGRSFQPRYSITCPTRKRDTQSSRLAQSPSSSSL